MDSRRPFLSFGPPANLGSEAPLSDSFEGEMTSLLQRRLRVLALFLFVVGGAFYALSAALRLARGEFALVGEEFPLLVGCLVWGASLLLLRGRRLSSRALSALDAAAVILVGGVLLADYHLQYRQGGERNLPYLGLVLVLRAVVVPSTALRTALVSATVPVAYFVIQWLHAKAGDRVGTTAPDWSTAPDKGPFSTLWWDAVVWDQVVLWIAVGMAALASRVNFTLRMRAFQARRLDRYVLEARIGQGSMGTVYRARHAWLARPVALKVVRPDLRDDAALARFEREIRQTSRLTHPNAISVYDCGLAQDGSLYYAMELMDGADLRRLVDRTGPMPAGRVIHVLAQACGALAEAHAQRLVHRDVKAENILLGERGGEWDVVKVMDFGLVRDLSASSVDDSEAGMLVGTPETIAPECAAGESATAASDLYGLAAVGCYLLTGRKLFEEPTLLATLNAHVHKEPRPPSSIEPSVPLDLERVLLRSLAKRPADRHASAAAMRADLLACDAARSWSRDEAAAWWDRNGAALRPASSPTTKTLRAQAPTVKDLRGARMTP